MICPKCHYEIQERSGAQNSKLWPMLHDVAEQVRWTLDGVLTYLNPGDWKDIFTCSLRKHQRVTDGIDGGSVFLGSRTSSMSKEEFSMLIELIYAFGSDPDHPVFWSEPAMKAYEKYRESL